MVIFIIGPGGVGKTTTGKILANKLGYDFIDLDFEFCERIENIGTFISNKGYEKYCYENSELFYKIINKQGDDNDFVFTLSSGFLVHEGFDSLILSHIKALKEKGLSILLLPSKSLEESLKVVIKRQMGRGFGLNEDKEREKFKKRFMKYQRFGDIQIFSSEKPEIVAEEMRNKITNFKFYVRTKISRTDRRRPYFQSRG